MPRGALAAAASESLAWWETTVLFVGVPAALFAVIALLAYRPRRARTSLTFPRLGIPVRTAVKPSVGPSGGDSASPSSDGMDAS